MSPSLWSATNVAIMVVAYWFVLFLLIRLSGGRLLEALGRDEGLTESRDEASGDLIVVRSVDVTRLILLALVPPVVLIAVVALARVL